MSTKLDATAFSGVSLALSIPTVSSFIIPAMGAGIANAAAVSAEEMHAAIVRSLRSCMLAGGGIIVVTGLLSVVGWSRLLGRSRPDPFPMSFAVFLVSVLMAVWITLLVGERILIAVGEVRKRIWANAITGPIALVGVMIVGMTHGSTWLYVLPIPVAMLSAASCSLVLAARLPFVRLPVILAEVFRRGANRSRRSPLTLWLILVEGSLVLPIWALRPAVSVGGSNEDVAALSLALQFATPVFSVLAVVAQSMWPYFAKNRFALERRDVLKHCCRMAAVAGALGACYVVGLWVLGHWGFVGHALPLQVLCAMGLYILARGGWEPARIIYATARTAGQLGAICGLACGIALAALWTSAGYAHGAAAVVCVAFAFVLDAALATIFLTTRLKGLNCQEGEKR